MSGSFWEKTVNSQPAIAQNPHTDEVHLDEEAVAEFQEDPNVDIFDEEEEDTLAIMSDANLRLEQGRLYQMVLQGDIFADTNADPKAIRNVQREIRKFVRERMETMLGIRQEQPAQETIISSPFNDMEVTVLRMLASKMSKGATEEVNNRQSGPSLPPPTPKKDGITSISGSLRPQTNATTTPLRKSAAPIKAQPALAKKAAPAKTAPKEDDSTLTKAIEDMTPEELAQHDAAAIARRSKNYAAMPANLTPHPTPQALEALYVAQTSNISAPGSAVANIMALMSNSSRK